MSQYTASLALRPPEGRGHMRWWCTARLVHWVVRRQWLGALPTGEALQAGRIALWQAAPALRP